MAAGESMVLLNTLAAFVSMYAHQLDVGLLLFFRMLGFTMTAPVLGRKDLPFPFRINIAFMITMLMMVHPSPAISHPGLIDSNNQFGLYVIQIFINLGVGLLIGWVGQLILDTLAAAGSLATNQIGLSAAMTFDPSTRTQVSILDKLFGYIALVLFFHIHGMHWMFSAINKTLTLIPLSSATPNFTELISAEVIIRMSANTLDVGLLLIGPVFIVTLAVDLILGIVNRTAQQIQVFQLSYALKPAVGVAIMWVTLPFFLDNARHYIEESLKIFNV